VSALLEWIDGFAWWKVALVSFAAGSLWGLVLRVARKGKYDPKEA
jgi:hypothetical protein